MEAATVVSQFLDAMRAAGVCPAESIAHALASGEPVRFKCEGDRRRNGWAVLHLDPPASGVFRYYKGGIRQTWTAGRQEALSPAERRRFREQARVREATRGRERRLAEAARATAARALWDGAGPASPSHPYLARKGIDVEGLRQAGRALLVPMHDIDGRLWNVQRIYPDGFKAFGVEGCKSGEGGRTKGLFCLIGGGGARCCLGEGVATMKAVRAATGHPVAAAISAENLLPVARAMRARWPALDLIICADDDAHLIDHPQIRKNLGLEYAKAAAAAVGGRLALPRQGDK